MSEYARPPEHDEKPKDADNRRAIRVRDICLSRREGKLEALRAAIGDLAEVNPEGRDPDDVLETCRALLRDRVRRLEGNDGEG